MMDKKGNMGLNYNYQIAVDSKNENGCRSIPNTECYRRTRTI